MGSKASLIVIACFLILIELGWLVKAEIIRKFPDYETHECARKCEVGKKMVCYYKFSAQWLYTNERNCMQCLNGTYGDCLNLECLPTDGTKRIVNVYNSQMPGPIIQICEGDTVVVDLSNHLIDVTTTIHWHGLHQKSTPFMDGVPLITQCPIQPFSTFRYQFIATETGTHWYHSHSSVQRGNGAFGALIVRTPDSVNLHKKLYDYDLREHVVTIIDWLYEVPFTVLYQILRNREFIEDQVSSLLINGLGPNRTNTVPPAKFIVKPGKRYRFRMIHAGSTACPIEFSIKGHNITVISSDGKDIEPITAQTLFLTNGERYDIILEANQVPDSYLMVYKGSIICTNKITYSILQYENTPNKTFTFNEVTSMDGSEVKVNCINVPRNTPNCKTYESMKALDSFPSILKRKPDYRYYIELDLINYTMPAFYGFDDTGSTVPYFNNITMTFPSTPLLFQEEGPLYCNKEDRSVCDNNLRMCECVHRVSFPQNSTVEIVFIDVSAERNLTHPIHLHGYSFYVVGGDKLKPNITSNDIKRLDSLGKIKRNFKKPPLKDTIQVINGGYAIIRFIANNPGYWFLHCHVDFHSEEGMAMVLKIGKGTPAIPAGFPTCGDYTPPIFVS